MHKISKKDYDILKHNYDRVMIHKNRIIKRLKYKVKKLSRDAKNKKLAIEWFQNKYETRKELLNKEKYGIVRISKAMK